MLAGILCCQIEVFNNMHMPKIKPILHQYNHRNHLQFSKLKLVPSQKSCLQTYAYGLRNLRHYGVDLRTYGSRWLRNLRPLTSLLFCVWCCMPRGSQLNSDVCRETGLKLSDDRKQEAQEGLQESTASLGMSYA